MKSARTHHRTPRSSVACIKCRLRKVRCDVSHRGHPCINCVLDHQECIVLPRSRRARPQASNTVDSHRSPPSISRLSSSEDGNLLSETGVETQLRDIDRERRPVDIPFQVYPGIKTDFLSQLSQDDIWYLDSRSCLRLPVRIWWNDLLQVYYRHINPLIPLFDKVNSWESSAGDSPATLSLFVAQAMLFAACPFASQRAIKECGFNNCREARAAFYQRAKLLYRLESESDSVAIVQGSLLLSLCSTPQTENPVNSVWLSIAIQHARSMGAHHPKPRGISLSSDWLQLRRLWWVCLIRDRILSLGYRRPLQIADHTWEAELDLLSTSEVYEEMYCSEVYSAPVRRALFFVFISLCHLCVPLTRILNLVVPTAGNFSTALRQADDCADALQHWHEDTLRRLEMADAEARSQDWVVLHYHLLQIYFHAARLHIFNFSITVFCSSSLGSFHYTHELRQSGSQIEASVEAITNSLSILALRHLVEYLPTSAVMCTVLPFVLNAVYVKLAPPELQRESSKKRIEIFHDVILALRTRYNNVNPVTNVIEKILAFTKSREPLTGWQQLIASQPGCYLRALRALDLLLSTGRFPCDPESRYLTAVNCLTGSTVEAVQPTAINGTGETPTAETQDQYPDITREQHLEKLGKELAESQPAGSFFYDMLALCQGHDMDTLLNLI